MNFDHDREPVRLAQQILDQFIVLREDVKSIAEGFAVLDFAQGHVATQLPSRTAGDIISVLRQAHAHNDGTYRNDLTLYWLECYRRAYSNIIMRVIEDGALTA